MKFLIGDIVLAGGIEARESPYDVSIRNEREVQIAGTLRGNAAKSYDRGNQRTIISFKVTRRHGYTEDAQKFILIHAPFLSNLSASVSIIGEASSDEFILPDAAVISVQSSSSGHASIYEYHIVGGIVSIVQD